MVTRSLVSYDDMDCAKDANGEIEWSPDHW